MTCLHRFVPIALTLAALQVGSCSDGDPTDPGQGAARFTTWGEDYIEREIPPGDGSDGFVDGWRVTFDKFLVTFHDITVADEAGRQVARLDRPRFVDNTRPGVKELVTFTGLPARAYARVGFVVAPATADAVVVGGADPADLTMMVDKGWSVYVKGAATRADPADPAKVSKKTFAWGFKTQSRYFDCQAAAEPGPVAPGLVVTTGQTDTSELTTHGDHLFYDRLQSGSGAAPTLLRFAEKAAADDAPTGDGDGDVTLAELCRSKIDPSLYDPSGLPAVHLGDFVIALSRTIAHFRGEGECAVQRVDTPPAGVKYPCDEYAAP